VPWQVHETRSRVHTAAQEEGKAASKKLKAEKDHEKGQHVPSKNKKSAEGESQSKSKKHKAEKPEPDGKGTVSKEFTEFQGPRRAALSVGHAQDSSSQWVRHFGIGRCSCLTMVLN
jgi:hypothetical protein